MTNNTIPNVPRELLENLIEQHITAHGCTTETARQAQLMLSAKSTAGVDGLPEFLTPELKSIGEAAVAKAVADQCYSVPVLQTVYAEAVLLSVVDDAQAIIDGLREDRDSHHRACIRAMEDRNQLAKCLKFARTTMSVVADNANLRGVEHRSLIAEVNRIDAALSAGKEGE